MCVRYYAAYAGTTCWAVLGHYTLYIRHTHTQTENRYSHQNVRNCVRPTTSKAGEMNQFLEDGLIFWRLGKVVQKAGFRAINGLLSGRNV